MRISIDVDSVHDTARVLAAAADEYELAAHSLQRADGLWGVTGPQRYWLIAGVEAVAARLRGVVAAHRGIADELGQRAGTAASHHSASPLYAGLAVAAAGSGGQPSIAFDRDGDGRDDTMAIDSDLDGIFETFVLDREQDGVYDTIIVSDASGNLLGAGFDHDQDGHMEGIVGVVGGGGVWMSDSRRDGTYEVTPLGNTAGVSTLPPPAIGAPIIGGFSSSEGIHTSAPLFSGGLIGGHGPSDGVHASPPLLAGDLIGGVNPQDSIHRMPGTHGGSGPGIISSPSRTLDETRAHIYGLVGWEGQVMTATPYFNDPGLVQPELGPSDTYDPYFDPRRDDDGDGLANRFDPRPTVHADDR